MPNANHTFYIDKRSNEAHISLDGEWKFIYTDSVSQPEALEFENAYTAQIPASVYRNVQQAGILPDPYFGTNSKLYEWVDKKIWYFKRSFILSDTADKDVYLCFDGVGYYCRIWLNGKPVMMKSARGEDVHEGMFGGPVLEVSDYVNAGENELLVEVTPPAPDFNRNSKHDERSQSEIVPWNLRRDNATSNGDFIVFGIWRSVRIEILPKCHMSRPHMYTESIEYSGSTPTKAKLRFEVEIADEQIKELDVVANDNTGWGQYSYAYSAGLDIRPTGKKLLLDICMIEKSTGNIAYTSSDVVDIYDKSYICANKSFRECQFFEKTIEIDNPLLWQPNGLGSPELYDVQLKLYNKSLLLDILNFNTGIRTIEYQLTAGKRHRTRWDKFHFVINGRPIFLKGMNWMPVDFLLDISDEDYTWALELAKNEGIQLLRIWSGGGMNEDDRFFDICDKLGIMVMQDSFIANQTSEKWDRQALASQVCQNLYRMRNHPSLALHTGGNEINPYAQNNDAAMWVISREIADLDPSRKFWRTSPDKGSAHIYRDMEPVWYRKIYGQLPFIGESGIHSFPNAKSLRQQISAEEFNRPLSNIFTDDFKTGNPELYNHFTEFVPERIPRMMSRASMINNIHGINLHELCEATQIASCEFYQIMINAMRENYPINCGVLPWVFKRAWTTVAIQLVDGLGDPIAPYYYVKNAYSPISVEIALNEVTYAPGESFTPSIKLICDDLRRYTGLTVRFEMYSPTLELVKTECFKCDISSDEYLLEFTPGEITIPENYTEKYFILRAAVENSSGMLNQSVYWCKVLSRFSDVKVRDMYRSAPQNNISFDNGPWLKPQITPNRGKLSFELLDKTCRSHGKERRLHLRLRVANTGAKPVFPVKFDLDEDNTLVYTNDNYFFLPVGMTREIELEARIKDSALDKVTLSLTAWNIDEQNLTVSV